jgi:hypothetical protein
VFSKDEYSLNVLTRQYHIVTKQLVVVYECPYEWDCDIIKTPNTCTSKILKDDWGMVLNLGVTAILGGTISKNIKVDPEVKVDTKKCCVDNEVGVMIIGEVEIKFQVIRKLALSWGIGIGPIVSVSGETPYSIIETETWATQSASLTTPCCKLK